MSRSPKSRAMRGPLRKSKSKNWDRHPEDWYIEPSWCSARLFEVERFEGSILDPACGSGRIVEGARKAGHYAFGSDIVARNPVCFNVLDFLTVKSITEPNIVSNPPFGIAEKFVAHALELAERKVAMLLPANWVQGDTRSRWLEQTPLRRVYFLAPRPSMPPGPAVIAGEKPGSGTTDYAWLVWHQGYDGRPEIAWLRRDASRRATLFDSARPSPSEHAEA